MRVCFVLSDPAEYDMMINLPFFSAVGVEFGKVFYSTEYLTPQLSSDRTDVLVMDLETPGPDPFECINAIHSQRPLIVILIAPHADYYYAYNAMKAQVNELLIRPLQPEQISQALLDASKAIRSQSTSAFASSNDKSRQVFAEQLAVIIDGRKTLRDINQAFHTTFKDGLFRVVSFALDYREISQIEEIAEQTWHIIRRPLINHIWFHTYDIVHAVIYNEIRLVLNYPASADNEIMRQLPGLFSYVQNACKDSPELKLFMGIGRAYTSINKLSKSCDESKSGLWFRMSSNYSKNRIATYTDDNLSNNYRAKILELDQKITNAMDTLNTKDFIHYVDAYFQLPTDILCSVLAKQVILNQVRHFRNQFEDQINLFDNASTFYYSTKMTLLTSQTFEEYHNRYIKSMTSMFERLSDHTEGASTSKYIARVTRIIENRYMEDLSLESVSEEVELSPNYLSRLFRKETGKTFTDALTEKRITVAKDLLSETDYRVKEICSAVGYSDQRYFSRIFQKIIGITPSEYRSINTSKDVKPR